MWSDWKCSFFSPSKLTSSKQGTKRQNQSMKIINEKWNAFHSFLITRIVAHNWAGVSLRLLHFWACVCVCVSDALCVCIIMHGCKSSQKQASKKMKLDVLEKSNIKGGQGEKGGEIWSTEVLEFSVSLVLYCPLLVMRRVTAAVSCVRRPLLFTSL